MAKEAAKPKKATAKKGQPKKENQVVQKAAEAAAKTANKVSKPAAKAASQAPKKASARGAKRKTSKVNRGDKFHCNECGLIVTVDEACGCAVCDIICCGTEMQPTK
jgi:hypothetical protein